MEWWVFTATALLYPIFLVSYEWNNSTKGNVYEQNANKFSYEQNVLAYEKNILLPLGRKAALEWNIWETLLSPADPFFRSFDNNFVFVHYQKIMFGDKP